MIKHLIVLSVLIGWASAAWWYYPALQDMRDTNYREAKCHAFQERSDLFNNDYQ